MTRAADPQVLGTLAATGCAAVWAFTVILYKPVIERFGAAATNLVKCALAAALYAGTILWRTGGQPQGEFAPAGTDALLLLMLSGVLGLTVSDTALFASFRHIGAQRGMLIQTTSPVFTVLLALWWTGETLTPRQTAATAVTMAGVVLVVLQGSGSALPGARPWLGYLAAVFAAITQSLGLLAQKPATDVLGETAVCLGRTGSAALVLVLLSPWTRAAQRGVALLGTPGPAARTALAALLGTWLGLMLLSYAVQHAPAGIVSALSTMTPVFLIPFSYLMERERHGARAIAGTLLAVAGVCALLL